MNTLAQHMFYEESTKIVSFNYHHILSNTHLISPLTKMKRLLQDCSSVAATMQQSNMYATIGGDKVAN